MLTAALWVGCDYCRWNPADEMCPPPPTAEERTCDRLVACERFAPADWGACVANHEALVTDPARCLACVESTACEELERECADACS
jgi:hypothetical protein